VPVILGALEATSRICIATQILQRSIAIRSVLCYRQVAAKVVDLSHAATKLK